ncbi:MAG: hypothetical protein PF439_04865 [Helicobacteraceae bacterium]|jgi:hypothetical protein|nr:hypothetical protein [Helicobacteraceae bacterium]
MLNKYQQFLELIQPQPGFKVLDVTSHADGLTEAVVKHLKSFDKHRLAVAMYPGEHNLFEPNEVLKLQEIPSFDLPFRALPRDNDVVIIRDVLHRHSQAERILKSIYTTLANTGDIIIVTKNEDVDVEAQKALLEKYEFRSANNIDILEGYTIVMAKKMHMWGNGL